MTYHCLSTSPEQTERLGEQVAQRLLDARRRQAFVALYGEMGVGKTAFTRGFARALGILGVKSPTYTLVREHPTGTLPLFHFDLYRIGDEDDLFAIGFEEYLAREGYAVCEWSERLGSLLPADAVCVTLCRAEEEGARRISVCIPDELLQEGHRPKEVSS
ncbi:MAG: tRNA (adenosine(37)-N6)-threonylcarbamoyltransferase complex ATPase subunit type 1 TsaE [Eubacteriales bacterium]